jgi:hypothetical protein
MLQGYKDKIAFVVDNGIFIETAVKLSQFFGETCYFSPWVEAYPKSDRRCVGEGIKGIERVYYVWAKIHEIEREKKVDKTVIVFPDLYEGDLQIELQQRGFRVWGSKLGDQLELHRKESKKYFKKLGLPVGDFEVIIGIDALREYLKKNDDVYVKISVTRGDMETKSSKNYAYVKQWLDNLQHTMGEQGTIQEFIVEKKLDAVAELGYDGYCVDGQWPKEALTGLEVKDKSYLGVVTPYKKMSPTLTEYTEAISETLKTYQYRNFMSTENRIMKDKTSYMNDGCKRQGSPPSELYINMFTNLPDIIWFGAEGKLIEPEWVDKWGAEVVIDSSAHDEKMWQHISFPEKYRDNVKLHQFKVINGGYYVLPLENSSVGAAVATGATMDEARKNVQKVCDEIEGDCLEIHSDCLDDAEEAIENLSKIGVVL